MVAHSASNVEAALLILQKAADAGQKYNILLLDLWLRGADASELISFLRQRPALLGKVSSEVPKKENVSGKVIQGISQVSKDIINRTSKEDKPSPEDQELEKMEKNKPKLNTTGDHEDKSTTGLGDSSTVSVYSKGAAGSSENMDQHRSGNPLHVDQIPGRVRVSNSMDHVMSSIIVLTSVNHTDINRYLYVIISSLGAMSRYSARFCCHV